MARLLLIDADPRYLEVCRAHFADAGHEVELSDGYGAWDAFNQFRPDAVVLEIVLDGVNGLDVMQRILSRDRQVLCILNSKYEMYRDHFMTWAADAYFTKTPDVSALAGSVEQLLLERGLLPAPQFCAAQ